MHLSVVIPVYNGAGTLCQCLMALAHSDLAPIECIVVDDGSSDGSAITAARYDTRVVSLRERCGPAYARNLGARLASGDLIVFLDADVAVHSDTLRLLAERFEREPDLDALIGAYDDSPADRGFVSQFKNLMHSFVHREGNAKAFSFWCGCGAVKRKVFLDHGGLDESYRRPAIEDIEFGIRLLQSGHKLSLDSDVQCTHLKAWTLWALIQTDIFQRGIPWTKLILRTRFLPDDLNLKWSQRVSVLLSAFLPFLCGTFAYQAIIKQALILPSSGIFLSVGTIVLILVLNRGFYRFLVSCRGWAFSISVWPLHILYYLYCGTSLLLGIGSYLLGRLTRARQFTNQVLRSGVEDSRPSVVTSLQFH
jgi:glycosyltransferase involved in cell wall biosynthesis